MESQNKGGATMTTQASTEMEALKARKKGRKRLMPVKRKRAIRSSAEDAKVEEEKPNEVIFLANDIASARKQGCYKRV